MIPGAAFRRVLSMYRARGLDVRTGLNPYHFGNWRDASFTALYSERGVLGTGGGISMQEYFLFECLFSLWSPKTVFIIGNAFGWSTLLLASLLPNAKVIALDAGVEGDDNMAGIELTNALAADHGLNAKAIYGRSPDDVTPVIQDHFDTPIDCCFIDGLHTDEQQITDFAATVAHMAPEHAFLFHDVVNWKLTRSFRQIATAVPNHVRVLMRTPSGMGIHYTSGVRELIEPVVDMFSEHPVVLEATWEEMRGNMFPSVADLPQR